MRTIQQLIHLSVLLSFLSTITYASNYYVDKNASGQNNGTSWTNAWESFTAINWGSIQPGDYLYVSGGTDSTIYYETMTVGADGTSDNQITIIAGKYAPNPTGHDGRVIIDGESSRTYGIHLDYISYVTVKGFECRNIERGIAIRHDAVSCIIDSNRVTNFTEQGGIRIDGSGSTCNPLDWTSSDHIIQNNIVISPTDVPTQCDGIYIQRCQDVLIHNNFVHNRNASVVNSHTDGIQTHCVMNLTFTNNVVIADSNAIGMPMVIRMESDGVGDADSVIFYNNLFYGGGLWFEGAPWVNCIDHQSDWGPSGVEPYTIMIHNTIISHGPFYAPVWKERHTETEKHLMINNIVAQYGDGDGGFPTQWHGTFRNSAGAWVVDNTLGGLYYREWDDFRCMQSVTGNGNTGSCYSWDSWVNTYGGTGTYGNPLFVSPIGYIEDEGDIRGELQVGSPAINAGVNIQAIVEGMGLPWTDINGDPRDNTPTIGAWEYDAGPDLTPPEVIGATLLDSIILKITFSEPLDPSTAQNPNNYSINNGITVVSALLTGSVVTLTTSPHASGTYTVTVSNVEDIAGNIVSPTANSADYDWTVIQDVTPPELIGVQIVEADKVVLDFSEPLDASQVSNLGNYIISEQMQVLVAELNTTQTRICLTTEEHLIEHIYTIEIHNLTDLAGNVISAQANSIFYKQLDLGQVNYFEYLMESVGASATTDTNTSPQKTLDGLVNGDPDPNSRWAAEIMPQWIQYDLGSVNNITLIASSFYNWNVGRIYQYSIQISEDGNQWNEVVTNQSSSSQEWTFNEMTQLTYARYVRIICLSNNQVNWAGLWETRILGPSQVPVELLSFSAEVSDVNNVELSWTTATETNCNSFEIERKTRNSDFLTIETVPGHGTTTEHHIYHITDRDLEFGFYIYRLKQIDFNGQSFYFNEIEVEVKGPEGFKLEQNFPNPFNPSTSIRFSLPKQTQLKINLYNMLGELVETIAEGNYEVGSYKVTFNASNLQSGVYAYRIESSDFVQTKKMMLLK